MRKTKDLSVTVVMTESDHNGLHALLEELSAQLREVRVTTPDDVAQSTGSTDVVHALGWAAGLSACDASLDVPLLMSLPGLATGNGLPADEAEMHVIQHADAVLVGSSMHRDEVHHLGVPWYRLATIPPSVDSGAYARRGPSAARTDRYRVAAEPGAAAEETEAMFDALRLVETAELILFADPGDGSDELRERVGSAGLSDRMAVVSPREADERAWWLRSIDAAIAIPRQPTDPALALQAMACGSAVVATRVDQLEDVVVHGVTGLHVPVGDSTSLARALRTVLADDFSIESFGMAASDRARSRFSTERVARDLASAYARSAGDVASTDDAEDVDLDAEDERERV